LLAVAATKEAGLALTIAMVHLLFNICGTLMFFPFKPMRRIPIALAEGLATLAVRNRLWIVVYLLVTFVGLPLAGILIWK
jgi:sodium-dependent phosphate cotransporter